MESTLGSRECDKRYWGIENPKGRLFNETFLTLVILFSTLQQRLGIFKFLLFESPQEIKSLKS